MIYLGVFFDIYSSWCSLNFLSLWEILCRYCFKYYFYFLCFLLLAFPLFACYTSRSCPTVLGYDILFLVLFNFLSLFLEVSIDISSNSESLSSAISTNNPIKAFIISVTMFLISSFFYSFLKFSSLCLYYISVLIHCLSFPLEPLAY